MTRRGESQEEFDKRHDFEEAMEGMRKEMAADLEKTQKEVTDGEK